MNNKHLFDEKQRFSLRKLTVGLASVLVGLTLFGTAQTANSQTVHAATITHEKNGDDVIGEEPSLDPSGNPIHEIVPIGFEANDQDQTIKYQTPDPNKEGQFITATDKDGHAIPDGHVTGKTDDMNKDVPMPNGYVPKTPGTDDKTNLNNPDPNTGKVPDKTVTVEHGHHTTAPGETHKVSDPITPNPSDPKDAKVPGNTYQQDINDADVKKDLTRTVTINKPKADGNTTIGEDGQQHIDLDPETKSSTVSYHRTTTVDDVTGKVTGHGDWQLVDPSKNQFAGVDIPVVDGYTANITKIDPENAPTANDAIEHYQSPKIVINYTADNQSVNYIFTDGAKGNVASGIVHGVTGQTVDSRTALDAVIKQLTDKGYDMSHVTIDSYKFKAQNGDITIDLANDHGIIKGVDPNPGGQNPDVPGDATKIPEGLKDTDGHIVTLDDTRKAITRTITASEPTGENETSRADRDLSQHGVVTRTFDYDPVTKTITHWNAWRPVSWDAVTFYNYPGYTSTIFDGDIHALDSIDSVTTSDPSYKDPEIRIIYMADSQGRNYVFTDGGTTVDQQTVYGYTHQTVDPSTQLGDIMNDLKRKGYDLAKINLGGNYKFEPSNDTKVIDLSHAHGFKEVGSNDTIPDGVTDPNKSGSDKHVTNSDVTETVTRHITFHDPTHENSTSTQDRNADQTVTLKRGFTYDDVTKQVTKYGDWTTQAVSAVDVPQVPGYKVAVSGADLQDGKIPGDTLRDGYTDPKIEVTYTAQDSTQTIHYVDENGHELSTTDNKDQDGNVIENSTVTVKTDEVGNVQVPKGWKLVDDHDQTTKVSYGDDGTIPVKNVTITHATIEVTPDKPHAKGTPIDPKVPTGSKYGAGLTKDDLNDVAYREIHFKLPASTSAENYAERLKDNGLSSAHVEEGTNNVIVRQEVAYKRTAVVDAITGEVKGYNPAGVKNQGWVPSGDKLVDAVIKNGGAVFNKVLIPQIAGYTVHTENAGVTTMKLANGSHAALSRLFVSFMAIPVPKDGNSTGAVNKEQVKPDNTKPGDAKPDTTPVKDLTKSDQKKIADETQSGKGDETKPDKGDETQPGKGDETKLGKSDETKLGKGDETKPGKGDETQPGKGDDTKPGKSDDTKPGKTDDTQPGKGDETKPGKGDETKPGKSDETKPCKGDDTKSGKSDDTKPGKADETKPGKSDETQPGKGDDTQPGKSDETKPGKGDNTKPGKGDDTKPGKADDTKPGKGDNTQPGKSDETKPGKGDETKPGKTDGTKQGKIDGAKPGKGDDTKSGKTDGTKQGKTDGAKSGEGDETKPGKGNDTKPSKTNDTKLDKSDGTKSGKTDGTKSGKSDGTKSGKTNGTKPGKGNDTKLGNAPVGNANTKTNKTSHTAGAAVVNSDTKSLPQTGESQNKLGIIGAVFASLAGMIGLVGTKKKRKND